MLKAWRITKKKYAKRPFDGEGARLYGGRWTSPGVPVVYASDNLSLALLEVLVQLQSSSILEAYTVYAVEFTEDLVEELDQKELPKDWRNYPAPPRIRKIGDDWVKKESSVVLRVPSAITIHEYNYIINPLHGDFSKLKVGSPVPFDIDPRLTAIK